jgi:hypothetical protein
MRTLTAALLLAAALLLVGCGTPGAPLPPTLDLPQPPDDLKATRKGDKVTLTWTVPAHTTDKALVKHLGPTKVCRSPQVMMSECTQAVGEVPAAQLQPGKPATFTDTLPQDFQQQNPASMMTYAVEIENAGGRSGGLSTQVRVPLAPTFPAPAAYGRVTPKGPEVYWRPANGCVAQGQLSCVYRVRRRLKDEPPEKEVALTDVEGRAERTDVDYDLKWTDTVAGWEKTYVYRVTPITRVTQAGGVTEVEGDDSQPVEIFAHDTFPPTVPSGVQAVYSGLAQQKFIDLTWAPVTDADLAGYNVYRHGEGAAPVKINSDLVKTPAFRDGNIQPGKTYLYSVSAVDLRDNESSKSQEASEKVPE